MRSKIPFCPQCGSVMNIEKKNEGSFFICSCGYSHKADGGSMSLSEKVDSKLLRVIESDENTLAVYDHICKKCGYDKAEVIEKGISYSDEDDVVLFKCGKCGHTEMMDAKVK